MRGPLGWGFPRGLRSGRSLLIAAAVILGLGGILGGMRYYAYASSRESTDDAFIEGDIVQVSPQVTGHVSQVYVADNQEVKPGDLLVAIDSRDFEARLAQARAALAAATSKEREARLTVGLTRVTSGAGQDQARAAVEAARAQVVAAHSRLAQARAQVQMALANADQARAQIAAAQAEATRTAADARRYRALYDENGVSRQQRDYAVTAAQAAAAELEAARKRAAAAEAQVAESRAAAQATADALRQAEAQLAEAQGRLAAAQTVSRQVAIRRAQAESAHAEIQQAEAGIAQAELDLSYTQISAPVAGRVTRKQVEAGDFVQAGQALMAIVPDRVWVIANFKETQLAYIRPGQPVTIRVDAYPARGFRGHVDSIQAGTGARFSLLPPENATGNYVKVVQRVPVKIVFDEPPDRQHPLGPGMSVVPEVRVR
jgi:membrane fusion protein (multidrug efflux system)